MAIPEHWDQRPRRHGRPYRCLMLLLAAGLLGQPQVCPGEDRGRILIGTEADYPPYSFVDPEGRLAGFNAELIQAIAEAMDLRVETRCDAWAPIRDDLASGSLDAICGMYQSAEREREFDFTPAYWVVLHGVFARSDSPEVQSLEDLGGKELIVMRGDIMHDYVLKRRLTDRLILVDTHADALRLLASGRHDYALLAKLPGLHWSNELGLSNIVCTGPPVHSADYCFAVREGDAELATLLAEGLAIVKQSGRYDKIYDRWLGVLEPRGHSFSQVLRYLGVCLAVTLLVAGVVVLWIHGRSRRALQESEERLRNIVDNASEIIYTLSQEGIFRFVSPAWTRVLGHEVSEVEGKAISAFVHPDDVARCAGYLKKVLETGQTRRGIEYRVRHNDGSWRWHTTAGSRAVGRDGAVYGVGIAEDVTERREAEAALRESERRLSTLLGNLRGMAYRCKNAPCWTMEFVSQGCRDLTGFEAAELIGNRKVAFSQIIHPEDRAAVWARVQDALRCRRSYLLEYRIFTASGEEKWVWEQGVGVYSEEDELLALEGYIADISERKRAEEEILRQKEAAEAANRAKSEFLANMSHEIRTPMTAILGYADVLAECTADEQGRQAGETIKRNGEHLLELINGILDLSKIEAGKMTLENVVCSPQAVLSEVVSLMQPPARAKNLALEAEYLGPIPATIRSDPARLRQILINLTANAIKFTENGGARITVRLLHAPRPQLVFDVADTGIGMNASTLKNLFEPFWQAQGGSNRQYGGTGLGLAISRRLARSLGGEVTVKSTPNQGSVFTLTIDAGDLEGVALVQNPSQAAPTGPAAPATTAVPPPRLACRILLAEDGPDNQRLISLLLKKAGATVAVVENGQAAVEQALAAERENPFDVVLMDMQMPVMDGYEATRQLRQLGYRRPILALTAHAMAEDRQRCLETGCDDYLSKPIHRQALLEMIARAAHPSARGPNRGSIEPHQKPGCSRRPSAATAPLP